MIFRLYAFEVCAHNLDCGVIQRNDLPVAADFDQRIGNIDLTVFLISCGSIFGKKCSEHFLDIILCHFLSGIGCDSNLTGVFLNSCCIDIGSVNIFHVNRYPGSSVLDVKFVFGDLVGHFLLTVVKKSV